MAQYKNEIWSMIIKFIHDSGKVTLNGDIKIKLN